MALPRPSKFLQEELESVPTRESVGTKMDLGKMALPRQSKLLQEELENVPTRESKSETTRCQKDIGIQRKRVSGGGKQRKRPSKRARAAENAVVAPEPQRAQGQQQYGGGYQQAGNYFMQQNHYQSQASSPVPWA